MAKKKLLPKINKNQITYAFTRTVDGIIGLEITANILPTSGLNSRQHWATRHRETQMWDLLLKQSCNDFIAVHKTDLCFPLRTAQLTLTRFSSNQMDWDNLAASWKHPVDSLVSNGLLQDDSWDVIAMPKIAWEKTKPGQGLIKIVMTTKKE